MQLLRFGFIIKLFRAPFKYFLKHAFKRGFIWNAFYFSFGTLFYLFQHCALVYLTKASSLQEYTVGQKISGSRAKMSQSLRQFSPSCYVNLKIHNTPNGENPILGLLIFLPTVHYILDQILSENVPILLFDVLHIKGLLFFIDF